MAQTMSVRLSRSDAAPWGFRLQGGKDFGSPLLIQKVNGGSPAERAGLQAGDAVIKVNNTDVYNLRHKDAQDNIVKAGNSFEITVQRGGNTWKPAVTPIGPTPVISNQSPATIQPVTKTSLAATRPAPSPIGGGYNYSPAPFNPSQTNGNAVPSIVNKQYNSPVGIYSEENIAETLSAQAEVLATGVLGVNFKKNEKNYDPANSEVFKMLNEIANEPRTPEPAPLATVPNVPAPTVPLYSTQGLRHVAAPEPRPVQDEQKTVLPPGQNICADCERLVVGVFVRIKDKNLHVECFKCATCGTSLKNVGYYNINNKLYCDVHAKLVARQNPPAPNLEPVTLPFGAAPPAGTISAALAKAVQPAAATPASPQPSSLGPMPFHAPRSVPTHVQASRPVQAPGSGASIAAKSFAAPPPAQSYAAPPPAQSYAAPPQAAPFSMPSKPAPPASGKFVWPPKIQVETESSSSTATPLYIPPAPLVQSASGVAQADQSQKTAPENIEPTPSPQIQAFPQPLSDYLSRQPASKSLSGYQYTPKPLGSNEASPGCPQPPVLAPTHTVTFHETVQDHHSAQATHKKFSVCSQEVMGITERKTLATSVEHISSSLDTAMMVASVTNRPPSPVPTDPPVLPPLLQAPRGQQTISHRPLTPLQALSYDVDPTPQASLMPREDEKQLIIALNNVLETQRETIEAIHNKSEQIADEYLHREEREVVPVKRASLPAESNPLSPKTPPLTYRQVPEEGFVPIEKASECQHSTLLPILVSQPEHSNLLTALTTAPTRPYSPLPPPMQPLSTKPVPFPQETQPYHPPTRADACPSPMISALTIAPTRAYSPFPVVKAPISVMDTVEEMHTNVSLGEPFNLPTPSHYTSMLSALTIAPDEPYSPLGGPASQVSAQVAATPGVETVPVVSVDNAVTTTAETVQDVCNTPADTAAAEKEPEVSQRTAPESEQQVEDKKSTAHGGQKKHVTIVQPPKEPVNALHLHRATQQRPITPALPRPLTPSSIAGLQKPAVIPYYQQNIGDGDFPCRSPRPGTPALACPMTESPRPITPVPHRQLQRVRAETPTMQKKQDRQVVSQSSASQGQVVSQSSADRSQVVSQSSGGQGQIVVSRTTRVNEEFESSHKESVQLIATSSSRGQSVVSTTQSTQELRQNVSAKAQSIQEYQQNVQERKQSVSQVQQNVLERKQSVPQVQQNLQERKQSVQKVQQNVQERKQSVQEVQQNVQERKQSVQKVQQNVQERKQSVPQVQQNVQERKQSVQEVQNDVPERKLSVQAAQQNFSDMTQSVPQVRQVKGMFEQKIQVENQVKQQQQQQHSLHPVPRRDFITFEESQRASPLPFPNLPLPQGMTFEVADNKATYLSGSSRQVYKIDSPFRPVPSVPQSVSTPARPVPTLAPTPTFKATAPVNKQPFVQFMAPKFEPLPTSAAPSVNPLSTVQPLAPRSAFQPLAPQTNSQSLTSQSNFQPVAPQKSFQPVAPQNNFLPLAPQKSFQPLAPQKSFQPVAPQNNFQPLAPQKTFQPLAPQNSFQPLAPQSAFQPITPQSAFQPLAPQPTLPSTSVNKPIKVPTASLPANHVLTTQLAKTPKGIPDFAPKGGHSFQGVVPKPSPKVPLVDVKRTPSCTSPPDVGGGGAKGASFAGSSAPIRGRGILNQAASAGGRVPLCGHCNLHIRGPFVTALGKIWCPEHFVCVNPQCKRQLADIGFVEEKGQLYCEYCFEQFIAPPCAKCSAKIKGDCLNAVGRQYHPECFVCAYCGKLFGNNPFFLEDGLPYCQADWNELFTTKCFACGFPIEAGDRWVEALNNNYHSQCFNCTSCKKNLEGQSFFAKSGRPFCKAHAR